MKYFRIENFLDEIENQLLVNWCAENPQAFAPSTVTTNEENYRKSLVAYSCPLMSLVTERVKTLIPIVSNALKLAITSISSIESQVTAHSEGNFFKIHTDRNERHCSHRVISYAYYFHSLPKSFEGGELALYGNHEKHNPTLITPDNNTLVFFPSTIWHEVLPVVGGSIFNNGRFTINGWINCL